MRLPWRHRHDWQTLIVPCMCGGQRKVCRGCGKTRCNKDES